MKLEGDSDHPLLTLHVPQSHGNVNKGKKSINAICFLPVPTNESDSSDDDDDDDNDRLFVTESRVHQVLRNRNNHHVVSGSTTMEARQSLSKLRLFRQRRLVSCHGTAKH